MNEGTCRLKMDGKAGDPAQGGLREKACCTGMTGGLKECVLSLVTDLQTRYNKCFYFSMLYFTHLP